MSLNFVLRCGVQLICEVSRGPTWMIPELPHDSTVISEPIVQQGFDRLLVSKVGCSDGMSC